MSALRLAVVGMGRRAMGLLRVLRELDGQIELAGLVDADPQKVRRELAEAKIEAQNVLVMDSVESIVRRRDEFDGVLIGTRCHLHTPLAVELAQARLPLFLEKPVAITTEQLEALAQAYQGREDQVVVSFPLRVTPLFLEVLDIVRSGRLGVINQIQAINNVNYGDVYYTTWYRRFDENGGLWLQKATHDLDYITLLAGARPASVAAMISRQAYDDPATAALLDAPLHAPDADEAKAELAKLPVRHQDAGSAVIMFENGLHAVYTQNFVTRRTAIRRGAVITGQAGTLEFDWPTDSIHVVDHGKHRIDRIEVKATDEGHGGGDHALLRNFIGVMRGKEVSQTTLIDGLVSAAACLAARKSANTHTYQPVIVPGLPAPTTGPRALEA